MSRRPVLVQAGTAHQGESTTTRRLLLVAAIFLVVTAALGLALLFAVNRNGGDHRTSSPPAAGAPAPTFTPDVTWTPAVGVNLPTSRINGPRITDTATARGFAQSEVGAALAAVHILIRSGANAGPNIYGPTITAQVTGANAPAMKLLNDELYSQLPATSDVEKGAPIPGADASVLGYRVGAYNPSAGPTTIEVYLGSPPLKAKQQAMRFDVQLVWSHEDWRVVAPARGDWGAAATAVTDDVPGLVTFGGSH